ncbi:MAG: signal peptide peptidase SppA [Planctomycetaceae bacterium]
MVRPSNVRFPELPSRVRLLAQSATLAALTAVLVFRIAVFSPASLLAQEKSAVAEEADETTADESKEDAKDESNAKSDAKSAIFAEIVLTGTYPEGAQLPGLFGTLTENLRDGLNRLDKAAGDDRIAGVILKLDDPTELQLDWSKANELRQAITKVREAGKPVYAWMTMPDAESYLVAAACDKVYMPESGTLLVLGLRAEVTFYKNLFDKLAIEPEMLRVGEFKSAAEPYTRTEMSPEFRKEMEELLDDLYNQMIAGIAKGRNLDEAKVREAVDNGPLTAAAAKDAGLIDGFAYEDEIDEVIEKDRKLEEAKVARKYGKKKVQTDFSGLQGFIELMNLIAGVEPDQADTGGAQIAVVYCTGAIMPGESQSGFLYGEVMGSETIVKAIDKARDDENVKAIVLRVDSPGGSALASDIIWRSVLLAKEKKPVVVSMGHVAASGGYYISMGADAIVAEPSTITGSIGVVGGKVAFDGLLNKIGVTTSVVSRGKNSGTLSVLEGFSDSEREAMQKMLNDIYRQFTAKAAKGRGMEVDKLEALARGRIYSGTRAKSLGLIDETGTLADTIEIAKTKAQERGLLDEDEETGIQTLPKAKSPLEELFGPLNDDAGAEAAVLLKALAATSPELAEKLSGLGVINLLARERVLTLMPFQVRVK